MHSESGKAAQPRIDSASAHGNLRLRKGEQMADLDTFRRETRNWLEANCPAEMREPMRDESDACWGGRNPTFKNDAQKAWMDVMAGRGWTVPDWPTEYGGGGLSPAETKILKQEMAAIGARNPLMSFGISMLGPALLKYGSEEQKKRFLPEIARGEIRWCQGYSEPGAGSDLASLQTKCEDKGDHWLVNGQKVWTSYADKADWIFCLVRTDPEAPKHKGISMIIVPMSTPGIEVRLLDLLGPHEIGAVHYDDVRVPAGNLVGGENNGWGLITNQLNHERVTVCSPGMVDQVVTDVRRWAQETKLPDGRRVADQEWVQVNLAKAHAGFEFLRLINWKVAWQAENKQLSVEDASTTKVFGTEHYMDAVGWLLEIVGEAGYLKEGTPGSVLKSRLESMYRSLTILTFGGGTNEIQRDLIGVFGLGMPMAKR
jgi:alkylation response protein AidB-like acyl-CoA dehydrogenase